ncbi:MAG: DUF192 domain-containing protein [Bacilli bacterium]
MKLIINNKTIEIITCQSFFSRLKGNMFKKTIKNGLCFPHCNSIHTFFMFTKIDVIMTDINHQILFIYKKLSPFKIILPKKAVFYVYEFPSGFVDNNILKDNQ